MRILTYNSFYGARHGGCISKRCGLPNVVNRITSVPRATVEARVLHVTAAGQHRARQSFTHVEYSLSRIHRPTLVLPKLETPKSATRTHTGIVSLVCMELERGCTPVHQLCIVTRFISRGRISCKPGVTSVAVMCSSVIWTLQTSDAATIVDLPHSVLLHAAVQAGVQSVESNVSRPPAVHKHCYCTAPSK